MTIGFEEYRGTSEDETPLAEEVARTYRTEHTTVWIGRHDFEDALDDILDAMDQPTIDGVNTWIVSRAASRVGLKVALSGLGADEFFGGYPSFRRLPAILRFASLFQGLPGLGRRARMLLAPIIARVAHPKFASVVEYGATWPEAYLLQRAVRLPWQLSMASAPPLPRVPCFKDSHTTVSYLELTQYMRNQLLRDSDWASMAHSLELRVPYVDVALARRVAATRNSGIRLGKRDIAATARPRLPASLLNRPKTGFRVPVQEWLIASRREVHSTSQSGLDLWQRAILRHFGTSTSLRGEYIDDESSYI